MLSLGQQQQQKIIWRHIIQSKKNQSIFIVFSS